MEQRDSVVLVDENGRDLLDQEDGIISKVEVHRTDLLQRGVSI